MRHISFIRPTLGIGASNDAMAPLVFAILRALTPPEIGTALLDERIEAFSPVPTDLAAITVETFTARRAYEIARYYRRNGIPVVMGGHHPSMLPEEALAHADAVVIGDAEAVWPAIIDDVRNGAMKRIYRSKPGGPLNVAFDRSVFAGKHYGPVTLVQAGRGCRFACDFCSIHAFYGTYREQRPVADIVAEIAALPHTPLLFFVDDNLFGRRDHFVALMEALVPLRRRWSCQITLDAARDDRLLDLMRAAGCALVLIGFESLDARNLKQMHKNWNKVAGEYADVIARLHSRGIMVYGTFVFGYDNDTSSTFAATAEFAVSSGLAIANFNPLTPMPGTALYRRLHEQGRLLRPNWWIDPAFRYGEPIFEPAAMTAADLRDGPMLARRIFYASSSIARRTLRGLWRWKRPMSSLLMAYANIVSRREIARKQLSPLSAGEAPMIRETAA